MLKEKLAERYVKKRLRDCNFEFAKQSLIALFSEAIIPKELAKALDNFIEKPCLDTAKELMKINPDFVAVFYSARKGGFTESLWRKGDMPFKHEKEKGPKT